VRAPRGLFLKRSYGGMYTGVNFKIDTAVHFD
jgi:hypothetical protein